MLYTIPLLLSGATQRTSSDAAEDSQGPPAALLDCKLEDLQVEFGQDDNVLSLRFNRRDPTALQTEQVDEWVHKRRSAFLG